MLIGEYLHTLDDKKRLMMPAKIRKSLGEEMVITKGLDNCLFVYPLSEWQKLADKLSKLPISQGNARSFARLILAGASETEIDSLGRILIPDYLREYAHLNKEIVIVGVYNRLEIWDKASWEEYRKNSESSGNDLAEKLGELGI
ncbi:MAG: Protein MraZ [Parcubacteria group bacterium GW2011_GWA2_39_18]|nr:MAG: Protein MraZ [Parcubacteria group bacterium GW2011_GWA2_39_18]